MSYCVLQRAHMNKTIERDRMADRTTFTFQTTPEIKQRLKNLAEVTRRSKAFLANEAVEQYLAAEEEFVAHVQEGISDADAGRSYTSAEVKTHLHKHIVEIAKAKKTV